MVKRMSGVALPWTNWSPRSDAAAGTAFGSRSFGQRSCALRCAPPRSGGERPRSASPNWTIDIFSVSATFGWPGRMVSPQPQ